jgi:hypothetical protein
MAREWTWLDEDVDEVVATVLRRYYRQMQCSVAMVAKFSGFNRCFAMIISMLRRVHRATSLTPHHSWFFGTLLFSMLLPQILTMGSLKFVRLAGVL